MTVKIPPFDPLGVIPKAKVQKFTVDTAGIYLDGTLITAVKEIEWTINHPPDVGKIVHVKAGDLASTLQNPAMAALVRQAEKLREQNEMTNAVELEMRKNLAAGARPVTTSAREKLLTILVDENVLAPEKRPPAPEAPPVLSKNDIIRALAAATGESLATLKTKMEEMDHVWGSQSLSKLDEKFFSAINGEGSASAVAAVTQRAVAQSEMDHYAMQKINDMRKVAMFQQQTSPEPSLCYGALPEPLSQQLERLIKIEGSPIPIRLQFMEDHRHVFIGVDCLVRDGYGPVEEIWWRDTAHIDRLMFEGSREMFQQALVRTEHYLNSILQRAVKEMLKNCLTISGSARGDNR